MAEIDPAQDDGQLELKKRARRRLVGAVALALAAVIVLPMVMDQEPKPLTQDIQIRIPSRDAGAPRSATVAAPPAAETKPATVLAAAPTTAPATPELPKVVEPTKPPAAEPKPETQVELPKAAPPKAAPQASPPPKATAPVEQAKAPVSESKSETKHDAKTEAAREQWIVQLGAYQDPANVRLLLAKLKELGLPSYTEKVDTEQGPRTRVRGGPFASRNAAEKAQAKLKRIGAGGPPGGIVAQKQ